MSEVSPGLPHPTRRQLIVGLTAAVALLQVGGATVDADADEAAPLDPLTRDTLEAFADTVIPGEKRSADDKVIAGAAAGPGAVQAGAITVLTLPQLPLTPLLPALAALINTRATTYAATHLVKLDPVLPPMVGLPFEHRIALLKELLAPGVANKLFTLVGAIASLAFDTAGHLHTPQAAGTHPGLVWLRFPRPDDDGLWRYPKSSYARVLARRHPQTTPSGSPA